MQINKLIRHNKFFITDPTHPILRSDGVQHISTIWQEEMCSPDTTQGTHLEMYDSQSTRMSIEESSTSNKLQIDQKTFGLSNSDQQILQNDNIQSMQYPDSSASLVPSSYVPNYDGSAGILSSEKNKYYQEIKEVLEQRSLASTSLNLLHKVTSQDMSVNP